MHLYFNKILIYLYLYVTFKFLKALHGYEVHNSSDYCAEIQKAGLRWEVNLKDHTCTCRAWQIKGIPCNHAAALIGSIRNVKWESYVDPYFTVARFKMTYDVGIAAIPSRRVGQPRSGLHNASAETNTAT